MVSTVRSFLLLVDLLHVFRPKKTETDVFLRDAWSGHGPVATSHVQRTTSGREWKMTLLQIHIEPPNRWVVEESCRSHRSGEYRSALLRPNVRGRTV